MPYLAISLDINEWTCLFSEEGGGNLPDGKYIVFPCFIDNHPG